MNIEFNSTAADIENINVRKKGKDNERASIIDVTMECEVAASMVEKLCLGADLPDLWDAQGDKRYPGIGTLTSVARFENHTMKLGELQFDDVELKSFSFQPMASERASLKFTATVFNPTEHQSGVLIDYYKMTHPVDIGGGPQADIEDEE